MSKYSDNHTEIYDLLIEAIDPQLILDKYFLSSIGRITAFVKHERKLYVQQADHLLTTKGNENE